MPNAGPASLTLLPGSEQPIGPRFTTSPSSCPRNGRTARLLSHVLPRRAGVGSALWSVPRGLAGNVGAYKAFLVRPDPPPQGALDGRGILSDGRLAEFCRFFMAACLDQVRFMRTQLSPEALSDRVRGFVAAEAAGGRLDPRLAPLLERAILFGEVPRAEVPFLVGTSDRQARRLVQPLVARGLRAGAKDAPLRIAFPLGETERLFPHLWAPSGVASEAAALPEIEEALRPAAPAVDNQSMPPPGRRPLGLPPSFPRGSPGL